MLLWTLFLCFKTLHDLAEALNLAKPTQWPGFTTYTSRSLCEPRQHQAIWCSWAQEKCVIMFLYCTCFALCSVQYFTRFCNYKMQAWRNLGLYLNLLSLDQGLKLKLLPGLNEDLWSNPRAALWRWNNNGGSWTLLETIVTSYFLQKVS